MQAWSLNHFIFNHVDRVGRLFLLDASLVVGTQAWSLDHLIFNDDARCGRLSLVGRKPACRDAGLVIG